MDIIEEIVKREIEKRDKIIDCLTISLKDGENFIQKLILETEGGKKYEPVREEIKN